jgi:hypothetical protein
MLAVENLSGCLPLCHFHGAAAHRAPQGGESAGADAALPPLPAGLPFALASEGDDSPPALTDPHMALREAAAQIAAIPLVSAPGTEFHYTELGYQVAGEDCASV